jgi:hypothetical protein
MSNIALLPHRFNRAHAAARRSLISRSTASTLALAGLLMVSASPLALAQSSSSGVAFAPSILAPSTQGLVSVVLENNANKPLPGQRITTFGHVFVQGAIPAGSGLTATVNGVAIPVDMTVKATYPDGSVRHAIVALKPPGLSTGAHSTVVLALGKAAPARLGIKTTDIVRSGYDPKVTFSFHNPATGTVTPITIDVGKLAATAITAGNAQVWLNNSLAKEVRVSTKLNPQMTATFDIRTTSDGQIRTDVIVSNDQAFVATQTYTYDVLVTNGTATLYKENGIRHYPYSDWHKEIWSGVSQSLVHVAFDPEYMAKTGAIATYDASLGVSRSALSANLTALAASNTGPLGSAFITQYMGTTGGRGDIGPVPTWTADYLVSQDQSAEAVMLANADAAGSVPWHLRDGATNEPISIDKHPTVWVDARSSTVPADTLGSPFDYSAAGSAWGLDTAHEADLAYVPYIVTGSHYYLDELQGEAAYLLAAVNPGYRSNSQGIFYTSSQTRGTAWNIRDVSNAAWISPDADPLKAYFLNKTANNIAEMYSLASQIHTSGIQGQTEGYFVNPYQPDNVGPWQQDFVALTLAQDSLRGFAQAGTVAAWQQNFLMGLYTNGANGYNPLHGPAYYLNTDSTLGGSQFTTWAQIYNGSFAGMAPLTTLDGFPDCTYCYPANAKATAAQLYNVTHSPQNLWAFAYLVANTPVLLSTYQQDPTWNITPILEDGYHLKTTDMQIAPPSGGNLSATGLHCLLAGGAGTNVLHGGNGISILYAGSGNTTMIAGLGTTYMFGGAGEGSAGSTAVVDATAIGQQIVMDFNPSINHLQINNSTAVGGHLATTANADLNGNAVLTLNSQHTVTLVGIPPSAVNANWVIFK